MNERAIRIVRSFDAPRERLWKEWTEPARFADWFGGVDATVPLSSVEMDVQEGGAWRLTMEFGERVIHWHGAYHEVVEPSRVVFTITDVPPPDADYHLITVELADLGDGRTEMRFEQRGPMPQAQVEAAGAGWGTFFDRIEERLAAEPSV
jgi:uncharacterized protein YndB with AHSA1/START domain